MHRASAFFLTTLASVVLLVLVLSPATALAPSSHRPRAKTALSAWTIPSPSFSMDYQRLAFSSSTWYNELDPTGRRMVYDDATPLDYSFVTTGDDWPTMLNDSPSPISASSNGPDAHPRQAARNNPLRRAAIWAGSRIRKQSS